MCHANNSYLRSFLLPALLLLLIGGCAGIGRQIERPRVSVTDIRIHEVQALEAVFLVELRIMNPNEFPLEIRGISCDLKINGRQFASGLSGEHRNIPAYGTGIVSIPVYASTVDMVSSVMRAIQAPRHGQIRPISYSLSGKVRLGGNVLEKSVVFKLSGTLPPPDMGPQGT